MAADAPAPCIATPSSALVFTVWYLQVLYTIYTLSYYHHQIGSMNYYPLFKVRSWNKSVHCMSFCILIRKDFRFLCWEMEETANIFQCIRKKIFTMVDVHYQFLTPEVPFTNILTLIQAWISNYILEINLIHVSERGSKKPVAKWQQCICYFIISILWNLFDLAIHLIFEVVLISVGTSWHFLWHLSLVPGHWSLICHMILQDAAFFKMYRD